MTEAVEEEFETHRRQMLGLAYRMTGSLSDAEDIVQDAYVRWQGVDQSTVRQPRAFLSTMVTRRCLDAWKSAKTRRETYVGPWLPEPVIGEQALGADGATDLAEDVSMALMLALERLSPVERAAFILHDVFDSSYTDVAQMLERNEASCRQLVARARARVRSQRLRFQPTRDQHERVLRAFVAAITTGDVKALRETLVEDAVLHTDGGGRVLAALRPIGGRDKVARFLIGVTRRFPPAPSARFVACEINGTPGFVIEDQGRVVQSMAFDLRGDRLEAIYVVRNPEKLTGKRR